MINDYIFIYINLLIYFYSENNNILQLFLKNFIKKFFFNNIIKIKKNI